MIKGTKTPQMMFPPGLSIAFAFLIAETGKDPQARPLSRRERDWEYGMIKLI
jgi:hypothetical protein